MKVTYYGHSAVLVRTAEHAILIDPFLNDNPLSPVKSNEMKCDFIILSHGHMDHVGDAVAIAKANKATVIATYELAMYVAAQGVNAHPMNIGGRAKFPFGDVKLTIAHHSSSVSVPGKEGEFLYLGNPAGILLRADGKTLYHAGDTGLFMDMQLIGKENIDLAMLPIGDDFTMGIADAVIAAEWLHPKKAMPIHYNTFDMIKADPYEFAKKVDAHAKGVKGIVMKPGETMEV
jgi:L-ascorbate metabolism protein UlaG (beta-lactamase superfamily)